MTTAPRAALVSIIVGSLVVAAALYVPWFGTDAFSAREGTAVYWNPFSFDEVAITVLCAAMIGLCLADVLWPYRRPVRVGIALGGPLMIGRLLDAIEAMLSVQDVGLGSAMTPAGAVAAAAGVGTIIVTDYGSSKRRVTDSGRRMTLLSGTTMGVMAGLLFLLSFVASGQRGAGWESVIFFTFGTVVVLVESLALIGLALIAMLTPRALVVQLLAALFGGLLGIAGLIGVTDTLA